MTDSQAKKQEDLTREELEAAIIRAMAVGMVSADNENYAIPLDVTIAQARVLLAALRMPPQTED